MPIPALNKLPPDPSFNDLVVKVNSLIGELTNVLLNLDSLNVVDLTADHIRSGTVDANVVTIRSDLAAGAFVQINGNGMVINNGVYDTFIADINGNVKANNITLHNDLLGSSFVRIDNNGMRINNGSFDTFTADVSGNVTMTRALIQSSPNSYPRVVLDPLSQFFGAYQTPTKGVLIEAYGLSENAPVLSWVDGSKFASQYFDTGGFSLISSEDVKISSFRDIYINPASSGRLYIPNWNRIINSNTLLSLQDALNEKASYGNATLGDGAHGHGIPNGTALMVAGGGTVIFTSAGNHSHSQT